MHCVTKPNSTALSKYTIKILSMLFVRLLVHVLFDSVHALCDQAQLS